MLNDSVIQLRYVELMYDSVHKDVIKQTWSSAASYLQKYLCYCTWFIVLSYWCYLILGGKWARSVSIQLQRHRVDILVEMRTDLFRSVYTESPD